MSFLLCRTMIVRTDREPSRAPTEMELEHDMFEANACELSRQARHQRIARLTGSLTTAWAGFVDRLTRPGRELQHRKDLLEQLETMPAYMLVDIGVTRDDVGRFCFYNDFGMLVELAPSPEPAKETPVGATGNLVRVSG